jgi:hypothetical protein
MAVNKSWMKRPLTISSTEIGTYEGSEVTGHNRPTVYTVVGDIPIEASTMPYAVTAYAAASSQTAGGYYQQIFFNTLKSRFEMSQAVALSTNNDSGYYDAYLPNLPLSQRPIGYYWVYYNPYIRPPKIAPGIRNETFDEYNAGKVGLCGPIGSYYYMSASTQYPMPAGHTIHRCRVVHNDEGTSILASVAVYYMNNSDLIYGRIRNSGSILAGYTINSVDNDNIVTITCL